VAFGTLLIFGCFREESAFEYPLFNHEFKEWFEVFLGMLSKVGGVDSLFILLLVLVTSRPCIISNDSVIPPGIVRSISTAGGVTTAFTLVLNESNALNAATDILSSAMFSRCNFALANGCAVSRYSSNA
jgi:hypothetical protein